MNKIITVNFNDDYETKKEEFETKVNKSLEFLKKENDLTSFNLEKTKLINHIKNNYQLESMIKQLLIDYGKREYICDDNNCIEYFIRTPFSEYHDQFDIQITIRNVDRGIKTHYLPLSIFNLAKLILEKPFSEFEDSIGRAVGSESVELIEQLIKDKLLKADKENFANEKSYKNIRSKFGKVLHISGTNMFATITFVRHMLDKDNNDCFVFTNIFYTSQDQTIVYCETFTLTKVCMEYLGNYFNSKQEELKKRQEELSKKKTEHLLVDEIKATEQKLKELKQKQKELKNN